MLTVLYTNTDSIRSVLGLTIEDMSDAMLTDRGLETELTLDLDSWVSTHNAIYLASVALSPTDEEKKQANLLALYSTFFCASVIADSTLRLAALQQIGDGKNTAKRFDNKLDGLIQYLTARADKFKQELLVALGNTAYTPTSPLLGVGAGYDPVTGA